MDTRYRNNSPALPIHYCNLLRDKRVCIVGCGGLGGYVIEMLARIGVGNLTIIDGDSFDKSNLNRQLLSEEENISKRKVVVAADRVARINSSVNVTPIAEFLTLENGEELLENHDLVIDALDSASARRDLAGVCFKLGLTLIHGAIDGWRAQVAVVLPGSQIIDVLYPDSLIVQDSYVSTLSFVPAFAASVQVSEAIKILCGIETKLTEGVLIVDLFDNQFRLIDIT